MKYCHPILGKKDPSEDKKLPDTPGPLSKVIPSSSNIASCNTEVTKVLKQAKPSVGKKCYTKLTPVQRYEVGKKQVYIKELREAGAPVNTAIVIATGKGIVMDKGQ